MVQPTAPGAPSEVTAVNDVPPTELADFVGNAQLAVDQQGDLISIVGTGTLSTDSVRFHEDETEDGTARVWQILQNGETFTAQNISE